MADLSYYNETGGAKANGQAAGSGTTVMAALLGMSVLCLAAAAAPEVRADAMPADVAAMLVERSTATRTFAVAAAPQTTAPVAGPPVLTRPDPVSDADYVFDSPDYLPASAAELAARDYVRKNRWNW